MLTDLTLPRTNADLMELVNDDGYYSFPASFNEYWQLVAEAEYRADYVAADLPRYVF
jgi:hypothetical protein